jgi:hypothetical protein
MMVSGSVEENKTRTIPVPDPTDKTVGLVMHEVELLKEMLISRLASMDKAMDVFSDNITRVPTDLDKQIAQLKDVVWQRFETEDEKFSTVNEKFVGVKNQFAERDVRVEQTARDTKTAVDAALAAQEKAVGKQNDSSGLAIAKSEAATSKQIDQLMTLINSIRDNLESKLNDMKERQTRFEGHDLGGQEAIENRRASGTSVAGIIGVAAAIVLGVASLIVTLISHVAR